MRTINGHLTQVTMAVGALILALAAATPSEGSSGPALTIRAVAVRGNEVAITVVNHTPRTQTGAVTSRVLMSGTTAGLVTPVTATPGQTVLIRFVMPDPVLGVLPLGVVLDDGVPF